MEGSRPEKEIRNEALLLLERRLAQQLVPVRPDEAFRRQSRERLMAIARRRSGGGEIIIRQENRLKVLAGAATVGSLLSLAGLAAFLWRCRWAKPPLSSR